MTKIRVNKQATGKNDINEQAKKIAKVIAQKYNPKKIILFGSVARGKTHKLSDIDLCIIKGL